MHMGGTTIHDYNAGVYIICISFQTTFLRPFMQSTENSLNPISELVEVTEEPVSKWRNFQVG